MNIMLNMDGVEIELTKDGFRESYDSVEDTYTSEAGTTIRDITRSGIYKLSVSYVGTDSEKRVLDEAVKKNFLEVTTFDESTTEQIERRMFIPPSSYSSSLIVEDDNNRYYNLSFDLEEF